MKPLRFAVLTLICPFLLGACGHLSPQKAALTATGYVSRELCTAVFLAGRDPVVYANQAIRPMAGPWGDLINVEVDHARAEVRASLLGGAHSRAVYLPPLGCQNATGTALQGHARDGALPSTDEAVVHSSDPRINAALDRAFAEELRPPYRHTQAVVLLHQGQIVAERYAPGVGIHTPLMGWSATKSVTNALLGILVQKGLLDMHAPAPIAAWAGPYDQRHRITPDQLLRMTSGLDVDQSLQGVGPFNRAAQMLFTESDMAAVAEQAALRHEPGTVWMYSDQNTLLLSRMVRDAAGGDAASTHAFIRRELLDKLGMRDATLEFDGAGTPMGASHMWASARDWARLGQLYLDDGVVHGERILPHGWVDDSARLTPGSERVGYGAGFWTDRGAGAGAAYRASLGIPGDTFMARGSHGQYVVIVPSAQLVVVRLGPAWTERDDMAVVGHLVSDAVAVLSP